MTINSNLKSKIIYLLVSIILALSTSVYANQKQENGISYEYSCTKNYPVCGFMPINVGLSGWDLKFVESSKPNQLIKMFQNALIFSIDSEEKQSSFSFENLKKFNIEELKKPIKNYGPSNFSIIEIANDYLIFKYRFITENNAFRHRIQKIIFKNSILATITFDTNFPDMDNNYIYILRSFDIITPTIQKFDSGDKASKVLIPSIGIYSIPIASLNLPFDIQNKMGIVPDQGDLILGAIKKNATINNDLFSGDIIQSVKGENRSREFSFIDANNDTINNQADVKFFRNRKEMSASNVQLFLADENYLKNETNYQLDLGQVLDFDMIKNQFDVKNQNHLKIFPNNFLCNLVLNVDGTEVDTSKRLAPFVTEAERRHLSVNDCRTTLGFISKDNNDLTGMFADNGNKTIDSEYSKISVSSENADTVNLKIAELKAQIEVLNSIIAEQTKLKDETNDLSSSYFEKSIQSARGQLVKLEKKYSVFDQSFSNYLTSIKPNDAKNYLTARKASEIYPKIPYYIPGTPEVGEFWIEPFVSDIGELRYNFKFVDPKDPIEKVRAQISMSQTQLEEMKKALFKLYNWSELAHQNRLRKAFEKRVSCFPETDCVPDQDSSDGKTSTEVRFIIYEDGSTGGRIQRNKGKFNEGYNFSIDSALLLQACISHIMNYSKQEFEAGKQNSKNLDAMFQ
jgi:hypothetical protein